MDLEILAYYASQYDGTIQYTDALMNGILNCLDEKNLMDDTIILLLSDHGEEMGEHGYVDHWTFHEKVERIPLLIRIPGMNHQKIEGCVQLEDVAPALLELAGIPIPDFMEGKSFVPLLTGEKQAIRRFNYATGAFWGMIRGPLEEALYKLVLPEEGTRKNQRLAFPYLFNLTEDPDELNNIYSTDSRVALALKNEFLTWKNGLGSARTDTEESTLDSEMKEDLKTMGYL